VRNVSFTSTSGVSPCFWPSRSTLRKNASENIGSMPPEQLAMMLIVPVGATVVTAALRIMRLCRVCQMLPCQFGKQPRSRASSSL
jgi:hypothetical protein